MLCWGAARHSLTNKALVAFVVVAPPALKQIPRGFEMNKHYVYCRAFLLDLIHK